MKKWLLKLFIIVYIIMAIIVTLSLLSYNNYDVINSKNHRYIIVQEKDFDYPKWSLVVFQKEDDILSLKNQEVYYLNHNRDICKGTVYSVIYENESYVLELDDDVYYYDSLLGTNIKHSYFILGIILSFFTNKYVYLLAIIFPIMLLFIYEICLLVKYIKKIRKKVNTKDLCDEKKENIEKN